MEEFPRLNNWPKQVSHKELLEYVEKLLDWCGEAEHILMAKELVSKRCNLKVDCLDCGENIWCFSDEGLEELKRVSGKVTKDGKTTN